MDEQPRKRMGTPEAIRCANAIVGQWRGALAEGIDLGQYRELLAQDLEQLAKALAVLTDWVPV